MVMAKKKIGLYLDTSVARKLDPIVKRCGNRLSMVASAAIQMFVDASEQEQLDALKAASAEEIDLIFGNLAKLDEAEAARKDLRGREPGSPNSQHKRPAAG